MNMLPMSVPRPLTSTAMRGILNCPLSFRQRVVQRFQHRE
jgi:hypothetical protein